MRPDANGFSAVVEAIVARHIDQADWVRTHRRNRSGGCYVSITRTIIARSGDQLTAIYRELSACPQVTL